MSLAQFAILLVIVCTVIEGAGQACLKKSASANSRLGWIAVGVCLLVFQGMVYTLALQWLDISTAYPLGALSFVVVTLLSSWVLRETVTPRRWMGVGLIMAGCMLIAL